MPPAPPQPAPDTLADSAHPVWQRGDIFRAVFFGILAVIYAILLFPLTVAALVLWLVGRVLDRGPNRSVEMTNPAGENRRDSNVT
jgi:hypothetical protein